MLKNGSREREKKKNDFTVCTVKCIGVNKERTGTENKRTLDLTSADPSLNNENSKILFCEGKSGNLTLLEVLEINN